MDITFHRTCMFFFWGGGGENRMYVWTEGHGYITYMLKASSRLCMACVVGAYT